MQVDGEPANNEPLMEAVDEAEPGIAPSITELRPADVMQETAETSDAMTGELTWPIRSGRGLPAKTYSDTFHAGGYAWNILIFPKARETGHLALYLNATDIHGQPFGWQRRASFKLIIIHQTDPSKSIVRDAEHTFDQKAQDWGFTNFVSLAELVDPVKGYLKDECFLVKAIVKVEKVDSLLYNSKEATGCVGLKNQGATCYMNSLLQTLFHLNAFRQAVYHMPTDDDGPQAMALALQSLFYKLQFGDGSVSTKDLTKSFGWDSLDAFMQHDVQELNRVLAEKLEEKMKGTVVDGTINKLFEGHSQNFMQCVNVDYKSIRQDPFMDLQLDVKGCRTIYDSFDKYCEVERLDGQNQYMAEGHGLQDAEKGVKFDSFPPVLQLQLKRFEYDFNRGITVKINDRYEFAEELDLDRNERAYLSDKADPNVRNLFRLHSVLVHSGGVHGGHYYSFTCVDGQKWLKFDDEKVTEQDAKRAINEQFGGEDENTNMNPPAYRFTKYSNAYMLVYVRASDWSNIMCEVQETDIAEHVRERLAKDKAEKEKKRKEKQEAHLFITVRIATDDDMKAQIGGTIHFDLVDFDKVEHQLKVRKALTFKDFKEEAAKEMGIPLEQQRWWQWHKRSNHTLRPNNIVDAKADDEAVSALGRPGPQPQYSPQPAQLNLYLERIQPTGLSLHQTLNSILLFLKLYNPDDATLTYVGHIFVTASSRAQQMLPLLLKKCGLEETASILLWEEIKSEPVVMVESISLSDTFSSAQLETGDIMVIQRSFTQEEAQKDRRISAKAYFEYQRNKVSINFRKLEEPKEEGRILVDLSRESTYDEIVGTLVQELSLFDKVKVAPTHIRLTGHGNYNANPSQHCFRWGQDGVLTHTHPPNAGQPDIMYYEVLSMPLAQLERLREMRVTWHNDRGEAVSDHDVMVPKDGCVRDLCSAVAEAVNQPHVTGNSMRLLDINNNRITKVYNPGESIEHVDTYWGPHAESIPLDQSDMGEGVALIPVCHFYRQGPHSVTHEWGDPILIQLSNTETFGIARERIVQRIAPESEEAEGWKIALLQRHGPPIFPNEDENVWKVMTEAMTNNRDLWHHPLGIEHPDTRPRKPPLRLPSPYEKPITIRS